MELMCGVCGSASGVICFCDREAAWLCRNLSGVSCVNISNVGVYVLGCYRPTRL